MRPGSAAYIGAGKAPPKRVFTSVMPSPISGSRNACTVQAFRDPEIGLGITDVNTRFGGAFPAPMYAALPGRTYPELIVRLARGERVEPHVGEFRAGHTFTRWFWQVELDERFEPTGRDITPDGPRPPR